MPGIDYRRLHEQIAMAQVLDLIGFEPRWRRGPQVRGRCPIPGCQSTSGHPFSVHLDSQVYHCFACGSHGNPLDLWTAVCDLPIHRAALALCHAAQLTLPWLPLQSTSVPRRAPRRNP